MNLLSFAEIKLCLPGRLDVLPGRLDVLMRSFQHRWSQAACSPAWLRHGVLLH